MKFWIITLFIFLFYIQGAIAAHYIIGNVGNALDGESANGHTVMLWSSIYGESENITDIVGISGNSGTNNYFMIDCELLDHPCQIGNYYNARVIDSGDNYISKNVSILVTGAGYDTTPNQNLNSIPNVSLIYPQNNANISRSLINFNCPTSDPDNNLANISLFGNWSSGWHRNKTIGLSGGQTNASFLRNLGEGSYFWNCLSGDLLSIYSFDELNFSFNLDLTPPKVSDVSVNITEVCGINSIGRVNCSVMDEFTGVEEVTIEAINPNNQSINYSTLFFEGVYYAEIPLNESGVWDFNCYAKDYGGNINVSSNESIVYSDKPEIYLYNNDIFTEILSPIENQTTPINVTIHNLACSATSPFLVALYLGDPQNNGIQIGLNESITLGPLANKSVLLNWSASIGNNLLYVLADVEGSLNEDVVDNNKGVLSINITAWQNLFGNISFEIKLAFGMGTINIWSNMSVNESTVFVADSEHTINWANLVAFGKNKSGQNSSIDFTELDNILGMSDFTDSITNIYTVEGNTPIGYANFTVRGSEINYVPIINSTINSVFFTGILWDATLDSDGEFDEYEKEDVVFATKTLKGAKGAFGNYDYEIFIPAKLRELYTNDVSQVYVYMELP